MIILMSTPASDGETGVSIEPDEENLAQFANMVSWMGAKVWKDDKQGQCT
jgi:hypothetical protein